MFFNHKISCTLLLILASAGWAMAQRELPDESVNIIKDFDARLLESNKLMVTPTLPALDTVTKRLDYTVPSKQAVVNYQKPSLKPLGMRSTGKEKTYDGYLKAGGGVPTSLFGEAGYYLHPGEKFDARLWLRHHSANAKSRENQRFFNNDVLLNGNLYLDNGLAIQGKVGYGYDRVHYYGYNPDSLSFPEEGVRQDYKLFEIAGKVYNGERNDADINYFVEPAVYVLSDFYSNKESGLNLQFGATKWFAEKHPLRLAIRTDLSSFQDTAKQPLNNIYLQPSFTFHNDFLRVKLGGNFASNRDIFYIFPDAEVNLRIFGDGLQLYAGAGGDLRKNSFRAVSEYNPFIQIRGSKLKNTQYRNYFGGIKGNLGWLEYSGQVSYAKATDMAMYQSLFENTGITRFRLLYDTVNVFSLQGTIKLVPLKDLTVSGSFSSSVFDPNNEAHTWGIPNIEGNFTALYALLDGKAQAKANLYIADQIPFLDRSGNTVYNGALLDLSVGGSYYFTKNIGVFLDINNMLNNRRQRWLDYPMFGLNILGGLTARF